MAYSDNSVSRLSSGYLFISKCRVPWTFLYAIISVLRRRRQRLFSFSLEALASLS